MTDYQPNQLSTPAADAQSNVDFSAAVVRILRTWRYRKNVIIATVLVHILLGTVYYFSATRKYQSTAKLLIIKQSQDELATVGDHESSDNTMATHRVLLTSPVVLEAAIRRLAPEHRIDLEGKPPNKWIETLANGLKATITRKTNVLDVAYRSKHPESAAAVVQSIIDSYLAFVRKNHQGTTGNRIQELRAEESEVSEKLRLKQQEFLENGRRVGQLAMGSDDQVVDPKIQSALKMNESLLKTRERVLELQASLHAVDATLANGGDINQHLVAIEAMVGRQMLLSSLGLSRDDMLVVADQKKKLLTAQKELASLGTYYGPNHPKMVELQSQVGSAQKFLANYRSNLGQQFDQIDNQQLGAMVRNIIVQSLQQAQQKEKEFAKAYEIARQDASDHSGKLVYHRMLEREVLQLEAQKNRIQESISIHDQRQTQAPIQATVVREPLPEQRPVSPQARLVAIFSIVSGFVLGGLIVYVQDVLDDRFNSPEEISLQLGVPILAMVRRLDSLQGSGMQTVHTHKLPTSAETEAFRTLRTALSLNSDVCDRILISSSEPGDGKTTISANLSVALAQAGHRTLVIDADLRRPGFTSLLEMKGLPGVADILSSDQPAEQIAPPLVHHTEVKGLDVLPVGLRRPNPAELLSTKAFIELLAWADSSYDRVIIDCPPVLAVSDAQIVGQLVDGAILVVRPEKNHRRSVIRAVESFQSAGCRLLGVVANGLSDDARGYGYGYGYGYGAEYGHEEAGADDVETSPIDQHATTYPMPVPPIPPVNQIATGDQTEHTTQQIRPRRVA